MNIKSRTGKEKMVIILVCLWHWSPVHRLATARSLRCCEGWQRCTQTVLMWLWWDLAFYNLIWDDIIKLKLRTFLRDVTKNIKMNLRLKLGKRKLIDYRGVFLIVDPAISTKRTTQPTYTSYSPWTPGHLLCRCW